MLDVARQYFRQYLRLVNAALLFADSVAKITRTCFFISIRPMERPGKLEQCLSIHTSQTASTKQNTAYLVFAFDLQRFCCTQNLEKLIL